MIEILSVIYVSAGIYVLYESLIYLGKKHNDGDPEGLDALTAFGVACFWPVTVPLFLIYKMFRG